jgi:hypothetical protein
MSKVIDLDKEQGLWILSQQLTSQDAVKYAYEISRQRPDLDLSAVLQEQGYLSPSHAQQVRAAVQQNFLSSNEFIYKPPASSPQFQDSQSTHSPKSTAPSEPTELLGPGQRFKDYELQSEISRGAMGVVLRAYQREAERMVALKFMLTDNPDESELQRFIREAQTLIRLKHDHIVEIYDFGSEGSQCYFAMELIEGQELSALVKQGLREGGPGLPVDEALNYMKAVGSALQYCHDQGILHRDLKPQNVIVEFTDKLPPRPVLVDFGLMKTLRKIEDSGHEGTIDQSLTMEGELVGTPAFMAPEQFDTSRGNVGPYTDVWAWAATLYYLLTGSPPYNKPSMIEIYQAILFEETPKLRCSRPDVPPWLEELCLRCLTKEIEKRPTFQEIQEVLDDHKTVPASRSGALILMAGLALCVLLAAVLVFLIPSKPVGLAQPISWIEATSSKEVTLSGRINQGLILIRIGGSPLICKEDGQFEVSVKLAEGPNHVSLEVKDKDRWIKLTTHDIHCDSQKPSFTIRNDQTASGVYIVGDEDSLTLSIEDRSPPFRVEIGAMKLDKQQSLTRISNIKNSKPIIEISVIDRFGHRTIKTVTVVTATTRQTFRKALSRLNNWKNADKAIQDLTFEWLESQLGDRFEFMGSKIYSCGRQAFRIGQYVHKKTGTQFHLIPGHKMDTDLWTSPEAAYIHSVLSILNLPATGPEIFAEAMIDEDMGDYGKKMRQIFQLNDDLSGSKAERAVKRRPKSLTTVKQKLKKWIRELKKNKSLAKQQRIIRPLLVGQLELTRNQWLLGLNKPARTVSGDLPTAGTPVLDIKKWLKKVGDGFRLPSWHEWEHACRAGTQSAYYWGEKQSLMKEYCWVYSNARGILKSTQGHKDKSNAFGLVDILGNAGEWALVDWDRWVRDINNTPDSRLNNSDKTKLIQNIDEWRDYALEMGGESNWYEDWTRPDYFYFVSKTSTKERVGFRVFITAPLGKSQ